MGSDNCKEDHGLGAVLPQSTRSCSRLIRLGDRPDLRQRTHEFAIMIDDASGPRSRTGGWIPECHGDRRHASRSRRGDIDLAVADHHRSVSPSAAISMGSGEVAGAD